VIAFNEAENIERCLRSVLAQNGANVCEVLVVDDASTDGTAEVVRRIRSSEPRVKLVRLPVNGGRGNARYVGTSRACGDLIAMVDADIVLPPHWLSACLRSIDGLSAVGGKAVPDGDITYLSRTFRLHPRGRPSTMTITGSNALYRREVFDVVGFDPGLTEGEDIALNHAMRQAGLGAALIPGLTVSHHERKGFWQSFRWLYQSGKGAARQLETYRQVRLPDLAFAGLSVALVAGCRQALRNRRPVALLFPLGWLVVVATGHMLACFRASRSDAARFVLATLVDVVLIGSYDAGRVVGHVSRRLRS
jgi:glycosyltransferase involved in cell wall biosynthesis